MFITATIPTIVSAIADRLRQRLDAEQREREAVHPDAEPAEDRGGDDLAAELLPPAEAAEVVDGADGRRDGGAEQDPAHLRRRAAGTRAPGTKMPRKSASPPSRGTPRGVWRRPSSGRSTTPSRRAMPPTAGVSSTTIARAISAPQRT